MFCLVDFLGWASKDADKRLLSSFRLASLASEWLICLTEQQEVLRSRNDSCLCCQKGQRPLPPATGRHQNRKITPEFNAVILSTNHRSLNLKHVILSVFSETEKLKKRKADKQIWCHHPELRPSGFWAERGSPSALSYFHYERSLEVNHWQQSSCMNK